MTISNLRSVGSLVQNQEIYFESIESHDSDQIEPGQPFGDFSLSK